MTYVPDELIVPIIINVLYFFVFKFDEEVVKSKNKSRNAGHIGSYFSTRSNSVVQR